jgi:hypothetical protein
MNLGKALKIARDNLKHPAKNSHQKAWRNRKMQEPGWWEKEKQRRNISRKNGGK